MKIQEALADLQFGLELADGETVQDAMILMRVYDLSKGRSTFAISVNNGIDPVVNEGLLACANKISAENGWRDLEDDE